MTLHLIAPDPQPLLQALAVHFPAHTCATWETRLEPGIDAAARQKPDVVLYHFDTAGEQTWEAAMQQLRQSGTEVVVLSEWPTFAYEAFRFEAAGFMLWPPDIGEMQEVLLRVERRIWEKSILQNQKPPA